MSKGQLFIISGPSGVGKDTLCSALRESNKDLVYSISATTRASREGEVHGEHYFFMTNEEFQNMIENDELLEWAEYAGNYYGTPSEFVRTKLEQGHDVILEIEVQGALKVREKFPDGVFIFLLPPSLEELKRRIERRGTETEQSIAVRMATAVEEMKLIEHYDYAIINDKIEVALAQIEAIFTAESCRQRRVMPKIKHWIGEVN